MNAESAPWEYALEEKSLIAWLEGQRMEQAEDGPPAPQPIHPTPGVALSALALLAMKIAGKCVNDKSTTPTIDDYCVAMSAIGYVSRLPPFDRESIRALARKHKFCAGRFLVVVHRVAKAMGRPVPHRLSDIHRERLVEARQRRKAA